MRLKSRSVGLSLVAGDVGVDGLVLKLPFPKHLSQDSRH